MPAIRSNFQKSYTVHFLTVKAREGTTKQHFHDMVKDYFRKQRTDVHLQVVKEPYKTPDVNKHFIWPDGRAYHYHLVYSVLRRGKPSPSKAKKLWTFLTKEGTYAGVHFMHVLPSKGNSALDIFNKYMTTPAKLKECDPELYGDQHIPEWKLQYKAAYSRWLCKTIMYITHPATHGKGAVAEAERQFGTQPREEDYRPTTSDPSPFILP